MNVNLEFHSKQSNFQNKSKFSFNQKSKVLEIASNDGSLLKEVNDKALYRHFLYLSRKLC